MSDVVADARRESAYGAITSRWVFPLIQWCDSGRIVKWHSFNLGTKRLVAALIAYLPCAP
jgi:hypothetical protein